MTVDRRMSLRRLGDKRLRARKRLGGLSGFKAFLREGRTEIECELQDLSSQGLALVVARSELFQLPRHGSELDVRLVAKRGTVPPIELCTRVANLRELSGGRIRIGLALLQRRVDSRIDDTRDGQRFRTNRMFQAHAYCEKPFDYWDFSHFVVEDLSVRGMALLSPERTDVFIPGTELHFVLSLPVIGMTQVQAVVRSVEVGPELTLRLGVEFVDPNLDFLRNVAEYLLISGVCADVNALRRQGFPVRRLSLAFQVRYASSVMDVEDIRKIFTSSSLSAPMGNLWQPDEEEAFLRTRQVLCTVGRRTVATWTLNFVNGDTSHSILHGRVVRFREDFLKRRFMEVPSYACIRGYRNADVLFAAMRHTLRVAFDTGFEFVVFPVGADILPVVQRSGFPMNGVAFISVGKQVLVVISVHEAMSSGSVRLRGSRFDVFKDLAEHARALEQRPRR